MASVPADGPEDSSEQAGRSRASRDVWFHLERPATMNWSTTIWAPLTKSPNWASQRTSASGAAIEYPYSKPSAAYSESGEF